MKINQVQITLFATCAIALTGCGSSSSESPSNGSGGMTVTTKPKADSKPSSPAPEAPAAAGTSSAMSKNEITETELGVPFYPGSTLDPKGNNGKFVDATHHNYDTQRNTPDSPDKVVAFYKEKLKGAKAAGGMDTFRVTGTLDSGATYTITIQKQGDHTMIMASTVHVTK